MNREYKVKHGLNKVGSEVYLEDGGWISVPFRAVITPKWKSDKSDFELKETEIGRVRFDYYTYIGPFDHNILVLSDGAFLYSGGNKYIFKKRDAVLLDNKVLYYSGILRKVWENHD